MHSYSLDTVSDYELQDKKVPYEGTLDQLYNTDFEKFIEYNRQDVMLIVETIHVAPTMKMMLILFKD